MTTYEKSKLLWIGGGVLGAVVSYAATKKPKDAISWGVIAALLVGGIGDKMLENQQGA